MPPRRIQAEARTFMFGNSTVAGDRQLEHLHDEETDRRFSTTDLKHAHLQIKYMVTVSKKYRDPHFSMYDYDKEILIDDSFTVQAISAFIVKDSIWCTELIINVPDGVHEACRTLNMQGIAPKIVKFICTDRSVFAMLPDPETGIPRRGVGEWAFSKFNVSDVIDKTRFDPFDERIIKRTVLFCATEIQILRYPE